MRAVSLIAVALLAGCSNFADQWVVHGDMRFTAADGPGHDHTVHIKAHREFGVDTGKREQRVQLVKTYLRRSCWDVEFVDEVFHPSGGVAQRDLTLGTYVAKVKCVRTR